MFILEGIHHAVSDLGGFSFFFFFFFLLGFLVSFYLSRPALALVMVRHGLWSSLAVEMGMEERLAPGRTGVIIASSMLE